MVSVPIVQLAHAKDLPLPAYSTSGSAGMDVHAAVADPISLKPGQCELIPTGLTVAIPEGYEIQVRPRSGLAAKHQIALPNSPGTIDSDYRGEIKIIMMNLGKTDFVISRGDRIAQLVLAAVPRIEWQQVDNLDETQRSAGGFGHTGVAHQHDSH